MNFFFFYITKKQDIKIQKKERKNDNKTIRKCESKVIIKNYKKERDRQTNLSTELNGNRMDCFVTNGNKTF